MQRITYVNPSISECAPHPMPILMRCAAQTYIDERARGSAKLTGFPGRLTLLSTHESSVAFRVGREERVAQGITTSSLTPYQHPPLLPRSCIESNIKQAPLNLRYAALLRPCNEPDAYCVKSASARGFEGCSA